MRLAALPAAAVAVAIVAAGCRAAPGPDLGPNLGTDPTTGLSSGSPSVGEAEAQLFFGEGSVEVSGGAGTCEGPVALGIAVFEDRVSVRIETGVSVQPDGSCVDGGLGGPPDFEFDGPPPERDGSWQASGSNPIIQWDVQGRLGVASSLLSGVILIQGGTVGGSITLRGIGLAPGLCTDELSRLCP